MTSEPVETKPWRLINMKIKPVVLDRIDGEARRSGLTRTAYMVACSDPAAKQGKAGK